MKLRGFRACCKINMLHVNCKVACSGYTAFYLRGISPTHFASLPHPFASFPQQICFISPTNCFVSPTKCCISPTNCCISPTIFSFPQHNFVSLCQKIKSSKFILLLIKIRTFAHYILENWQWSCGDDGVRQGGWCGGQPGGWQGDDQGGGGSIRWSFWGKVINSSSTEFNSSPIYFHFLKADSLKTSSVIPLLCSKID